MTQGNLFGHEYGCISADPPWDESGGGKIKRGAQRHYPLIKFKEDIRDAMLNSGVWRPADDCHLWLWVTNNFLEDGLWLMRELGFKYLTNRAWAKMEEHGQTEPHGTHDGKTLYKKQHHGLGQYIWGEHELLLFGRRGMPARPGPSLRPGSLLCAPRTRQHSEKPPEAYLDMERVSPGPRLEMFARAPRAGWEVWGLESDGSRVIAEEAKRIER
jgi:N6-adenosine-specific RNA methylase IME4